MTRDLVRPGGRGRRVLLPPALARRVLPPALARRVLLPPALAGGAAIFLLVVLAAATEPSARDGGSLAAPERETAHVIAVKLSQDLEGEPSVVDVRRARLPVGERARRLRAHPYYRLYMAAKRRYEVSWFLVAAIHYQETGYRRAGAGAGAAASARGRRARVRPRDFDRVMAIASRLHAAGARGLGPPAVRATARRYGSGADGDLSTAMVIERARAWRVVGVIPLPGSGELATPVRGTIGGCGYFGCPRPGHLHNGVDFLAPAGTPVHAADAGRVAIVQAPQASGGYGNFICLQHRPHLASCYAHLSAFAPDLPVGERVRRGQVIGLVGSTGSSTAPHLHFEVRRAAASCQSCAIDPMALLDGQVPQASVPELLRRPRRAREQAPAPAASRAGYGAPAVAPPTTTARPPALPGPGATEQQQPPSPSQPAPKRPPAPPERKPAPPERKAPSPEPKPAPPPKPSPPSPPVPSAPPPTAPPPQSPPAAQPSGGVSPRP